MAIGDKTMYQMSKQHMQCKTDSLEIALRFITLGWFVIKLEK